MADLSSIFGKPTTAVQKRASKGRERALLNRATFFPHVTDDMLWNRSRHHGFGTLPRTIPLVMNVIDYLSKSKPAGRTYSGLWFRAYDESLIVVENPMSLAFEAGFSGERAVTTWRERMNTLRTLGFIESRPGSSGEFHFVVLLNPHKVVWKLQDQIQPQMFMQLFDRAAEVGAEDMRAPVAPEVVDAAPSAAKKSTKKSSKAVKKVSGV